jgi:hypothetical protein
MHDNYGFDTPVRSTDWTIVKAGPSLKAARNHLEKLTNFQQGKSR